MNRGLRKDKWLRYLFMEKDNRLIPHLPETHLFTKKSLQEMIDKYGQVILKPAIGSRGFGVIHVSPLKNNRYQIHHENKKTKIQGIKKTYRKLKELTGSRRYMVQKRVQLAQIGSRPFDIRVIVQRKSSSDPWKVTGKMAKVAGKGYIVTNNERSNGSLMTVKRAIQKSSLKHLSLQHILSEIDQVALLSAESLTGRYPDHRIYGLDMGVDQQGQIWIIEANRSPMLSHFRKLKDQRMYRRILKYKKGE
ncbi:hypothetical protein HMPREF9374_3707 [Desmospora sp. 8437]|nr:hypothetical protein HMPREF9374_3707 [Desmospora sp. 8437]